MADEGITIGLSSSSGDVQNIENLVKAFGDLDSNIERSIQRIINLCDAFNELDAYKTEKVFATIKDFASGNVFAGLKDVAGIVIDLWEEQAKRVEQAAEAYKSLNKEVKEQVDISKQLLQEMQSTGATSQNVTASSDRALGAAMSGRATGWLGWAQGVGAGVQDFFNGENTEEDFRRRGAEMRNRQNETNRLRAQKEARDDAEQAVNEQIAFFEQEEQEKRQREAIAENDRNDAVAERDSKFRMKQAEEREKERKKIEGEIEREEGRKAALVERFQKEGAMQAIRAQKDDQFTASIDSSAQAVYNRIATASGSTGKTNEQIAREQDALREKWKNEALAKQDKIIEELQKKKGGLI